MSRSTSFARAVFCLILAAFACLSLPPSALAQQALHTAGEQAAQVQTHMVPMRDGVELATDVHLGAGDGPWPVILLRTPYNREGIKADGWEDYVVVAQDVRGRFASKGHALAFFDDGWGEHQDGLDTVKWILAQPWCNGKIGTMGGSALGITQDLLAGANPPGVLGQHIVVADGNLYHVMYPGGAFTEALIAGWLKATKWPEDNLKLIQAHPSYDSLWETVNADARVREQHVNIPAVHVGGWFDIFTQGTLDSFVARSAISPNQWLIMGPWPHGIKREVGELVFPPNAVETPKPLADAHPWFDFWLRAEDNEVRGMPRVHYYVMGACGEGGAPGNEWRTADSWPVRARSTPLYFSTDGRLLPQAPAKSAGLSYSCDPAKPVPTRGGGNLLIPAGPMDQSELEKRGDVLVFSTPPLQQPVEVTGRITVRLYASSSARDTMFTAKLCDVYPDGRSMLLTDGALRAACRESLSDPTPIQPGQVYQFNIGLGSTSIIFNRGHRIRVDISSSNAPRFAVHPNVWGEGKPQVAQQTVLCGGRQVSEVILPIVGSNVGLRAAAAGRP